MTGLIERKKKTLNKRGPSLERKKRQGDPAEELAAGMWKKMALRSSMDDVQIVCSLEVHVYGLNFEVISHCLWSPVHARVTFHWP